MSTISYIDTRFLRRALQANGVFSGISGLLMMLAAGPLSELIGLSISSILIGVGAGLIFYAIGLFRNASSALINRTEAYLAVVMDLAWVVGSAVVIFLGVLTTTGNWMVAVVADIVLMFGILQGYGLKKMQDGVSDL